MKFTLLAFAMLFSQGLLAQNKTGTGGVLDHPDSGTKPLIEVTDGEGGKRTEQEIKLVVFASTLYSQEKLCRTNDQRYIYLLSSDFMESYLKLSVLKNTFEADDKCQDISAYLKCLYTPKAKQELKKILEDKKMKAHLVKQYKLDDKEAQGVLDFFKKLDTSCEEKGACKM